MKKKLLVSLLFTICFWHINVTADDSSTSSLVSDVPTEAEVLEEKNESQQEKQNDNVEQKKEEETKNDAEANAKESNDTKADANGASDGKVTINFIDTRDGSTVGTLVTNNNDSQDANKKLSELFPSMSTSFEIDTPTHKYKFLGFYTQAEGGDKIDKDYNPGTLYPMFSKLRSTSSATTPGNYRFQARAKATVEDNLSVNIYIRWQITEKIVRSVTVNFIDTRNGNTVGTLVTYTSDSAYVKKSLSSLFPGISTNFQIETETEIDTFKGFYTESDGGDMIDRNYTPGTNYPMFRTFRSTSTAATPSNYYFHAEATKSLTENQSVNVYVQWEIEKKQDIHVNHTVNVNVVDTRDGNIVTTLSTNTTDTSVETKSISSMIAGLDNNFKITVDNYIYTFKGFYTESDGGDKIDKNYDPTTLFPSLRTLNSVSDATHPANYLLKVRAASELDSDKTVTVYIQWDKEEIIPDPVEHTITVNIVDTRNGNIIGTINTKNTDTTLSSITLSSMISEINDNFKIINADYMYTFKGFYTESDGGDKIDTTYDPTNTFPYLKTLNSTSNATKPSMYKLQVQAASTLEEDNSITIYIQWDKEDAPIEEHIVTINIIDTRDDSIVGTITTKNTDTNATTKKVSELSLDMRTDLIVNTETKQYTFKGFYTDYNGELIGNDYTPAQTYPSLSTLYANIDNSSIHYELIAQANSSLEEDTTINVYILWDEKDVENGSVTINFIDTRDDSVVGSLVAIAHDGGSNTRSVLQLFPNAKNEANNIIVEENGFKYTFGGFYTTEHGGELITRNFIPTEYPGIATMNTNSDVTGAANYKLLLATDNDLKDHLTYNVYVYWTAEGMHELTINLYDAKEGKTPTIIKKIERTILPGISWTKIYTIDQVFNEKNSSRPYSGVLDANDNTETDANHTYTFLGWYDAEENGNKIEEGYTLEGILAKVFKNLPLPDGTAIGNRHAGDTLYELSFSLRKSLDDDYEIDLYAYWDSIETAYLKIRNENYINEYGRTSWENSESSAESYTHTYSNPKEPNTHKFLYWIVYNEDGSEYDGERYNNDNPTFTFNFKEQDPGSTTVLVGKAWWKAQVTLNLYDEDELLSTETSFDSVSISINPEKEYYVFMGWVDENGNDITDTTFYSETGVQPTPQEINLYAKWKKVQRDIVISKEWSDDNNHYGKRPNSVTIVLLDGNENEIDRAELSDNNKWSYTFTKLPIYDEDENTITYNVKEENIPEGYTMAIEKTEDGFIIHNVLGQGDGQPDKPLNPQTLDNIYIYIITLFISIYGIIICTKKSSIKI